MDESEDRRCLFEKISILISADGSTAGCGLPRPDADHGMYISPRHENAPSD
jgi:hypothetical protein